MYMYSEQTKLTTSMYIFFQSTMYDVCLKTCDDGMDGTEVFPEFPNIIGDR